MCKQMPNIVMILADDLGYGDCSCYGQKTWTTPNIDRMAAEGIRFTDFYTTSPVCSPARASILTGLNSGHLPIRHLGDPYLPDSAPTIPKLLKHQGYVSACIGKYGVGSGQPDVDPIRKGFDYHYGYNCMYHAHNYYPPFLRENGMKVGLRNKPPEGDTKQWETGGGVAEVKVDYSPDFIESRALDFIRDCRDTPFFLYYCPTMPHANNEGGETPDGMEVDTYGEFESRDWSPNEKGFARMVQRIDITVGRVMDTLKALGIAENTLVLFASDNGPHNEGGHSVTRFDSSGGFQGYKRSLHEGGIRIPFIAWWPGTVEPGVSAHTGYFPDLLPTFCEMTHSNSDGMGDGISFLPLLTGGQDKQQLHEHLYFEYGDQRAVRKGPWKYYANASGEESLFNLDEDRHEDHDVKASQPVIFSDLRSCVAREHQDYTPSQTPVYYDPAYHRIKSIMQGQRIFYTGHSFHWDIVPMMKDIAESAGISGQENLGVSSIGGSRVIQHWDVPDATNQAKKVLGTGKVDVLTMAPIFMPDEGIEKFATLALEKNPKIRITVQEDWLWRDTYEQIGDLQSVSRTWDYDAITGAELREIHAPLFKSIDEHIAALNRKFGKTVLFIVPAGQAVIALRERIIAGNAGRLKTQSELFRDRVGHPAVPLQVLVAYCHFAVIYRRSPVGLPTPENMAKAKKSEWSDETVRVLQEVAWEAVTQHPQSGVRGARTC